MITDFPHRVGKSTSPWSENLFKVNKKEQKLDSAKQATFHTFVMKAMFLCKRARPDIEPVVGFLLTRTKEPNTGDWRKLLKMMAFLNETMEDILTLMADDLGALYWYIDAAFAVHKDMRSHTGSIFSLGYGVILSSSTKQKVNTRSSTEAELVGVDDKISKILGTKRFLEWLGFEVKLNVIYQDNTSSMKLEENGLASTGKRTRHFDIKLFYVTDLIGRSEVQVEYCPTDIMVADYMTKPLTGRKFQQFRRLIMNLP